MATGFQKFLFDQNNFDDNSKREDEDAPPPPVFSEEELLAAKEAAYAKGKQDGLAQAEASREKKTTELVAAILRQTAELFAAEEKRVKLFECDALLLTQAIFSRLFPLLMQNHGLNETINTIEQVIEKCREKPEILVEVSADYVDAVHAAIEKAANARQLPGHIRTAPNESLAQGVCKVVWKDGGAHRDPEHVAKQIENLLKEMLADKAGLRDNEGTEAMP